MNEILSNLETEMVKAEQAEDAAMDAILARVNNLPQVDCVNESTVVTDADCARYVAAVQTQISRDFFPHWDLDARLNFIPHGGKPNQAHWWIVIGNTSDQLSALGYHYVSNSGQPLGYVFAKSDLDNGASVSVTLSHEILEMILDPFINLTVQLDQTRFVSYEVADATEADRDGYMIGDVLVSDFVLPSYFAPECPGPWDFRELLTAGMPSIRPDGYLSIFTAGSGWGQINSATSPKMKMKAIPHVGSRRQRRTTPRAEWVKSEVKL